MLYFKFTLQLDPKNRLYTQLGQQRKHARTHAHKKTKSVFHPAVNFKCTKKGRFHTSHSNIFKNVCVEGNTINKTNGTEGFDNLILEAQCLVKYSQETKY